MKNFLKKVLPILALFLPPLIGMFIGYSFGDWILSATEYVRPKDILQYRIGLPLLIAAIFFFFFGLNAAAWVEDQFKNNG